MLCAMTLVTDFARYKADVGIKDGRIASIGGINASEGSEVIDASGRIMRTSASAAAPLKIL